jgi:membrane protein implicated in regulation of membrane protease activity
VNKKLNTALFFVVGTVLNLVLVLVLALVVFVPWVIFAARVVPGSVNLVVFALTIVGSLVGSLFLYRMIVDAFQKRVDMEKYFDPIVKSRNRGPRR